MKKLIARLKHAYTIENIKYMYSIRPVMTILAIAGDVIIAMAVVAVVVFGVGVIV